MNGAYALDPAKEAGEFNEISVFRNRAKLFTASGERLPVIPVMNKLD